MPLTFSVCIPTVARPYRAHLFRRLVETGTLDHPLVTGFHVVYGRGPNDNATHALQAAVRDGADYVIFLEDDIEIVDDFIGSIARWMADVYDPRVHVYPLGCAARRAARRCLNEGILTWRYPVKEFFGACGLVFPTTSAKAFCDVCVQHPEWMMEWNGLDVNIKRWHQRIEPAQHYLLTPFPCLIDHRGETSSLSTDPAHFTGRYEGFIGTEWTYRGAAYETRVESTP